jgi:hypothetical protein
LLETISFAVLQEVFAETLSIDNFQLLTSISMPQLKKITMQNNASMNIISNAALPSLSFPDLTDIECTDTVSGNFSVNFADNPLLASINLSKLENIDKVGFCNLSFNSLPVCSSIDLSKLTKGNNIGFGYSFVNYDNVGLITSVLFPEALTGISFSVGNCPLVEVVSAPKLATTSSIGVGSCAAVTSFSLPLLTLLTTGVSATGNPLLTNISLPILAASGYIFIVNNPSLNSLTVSASLNCIDVNCSNNALNLMSVDNMLAALDASGVINGVVNLSGGTNATPTGGALNVNVVSLQGKGWTVTTN